ncbi:hypothetical protein LNTAR_03964, partial [Lentisphaera araneosa HTCC2155]
ARCAHQSLESSTRVDMIANAANSALGSVLSPAMQHVLIFEFTTVIPPCLSMKIQIKKSMLRLKKSVWPSGKSLSLKKLGPRLAPKLTIPYVNVLS